jgi:cytochrome b561
MRAELSSGWTKAQRRLHWWTAALVLLVFPLGWLMVGVPLNQLLLKFLLYQLHKTLGILAFALAVIRLLVRARRARPSWDEGIPDWQRQAASAVHALLYAGLLATPMLGYFTAATAPIGIPTLFLGVIPIPHIVSPNPVWFSIVRQIHRSMAILLVVLAGGHAAASIHNHIRGRGTLVRMWRDREVRHPHQPNA